MLKKSISVVLAVLMTVGLFTAVPLTASAEEVHQEDDYSYVVVTDESGETPVSYAEITAFSGSDPEIEIPEALGGYEVRTIRREAFRGNTFASVVFPNTVTFIADYAFADCTELNSVTLPGQLEDLARASFYNCTSLEEVTLPATLTKCYSNSGTWLTFRGPFSGCSALTTINFESGFTTIPDYLFEGCTGLAKMNNIPNTVTSIGEYAFRGCSSLESIVIPNSVTSVGANAFSGCSSLASATIGSGLTTVSSNMFENCTSLETLTLTDTLETIDDYAFSGCTSLNEVTLPSSITKLDSCAFRNCTGLTKINIPKSLTDGNGSDYGPFRGCSSLNTIEFENGVTTIPRHLFADCSGLTSITIPATATSVGDDAFNGCTNLATVSFGDNVTSIGSSAFYGCISLSGVTLPKNLEALNSSSFGKCTSLESIEIPASLTSAGTSSYGPFYNCSSLKTVTFENGTTAIPAYIFARCNGIEEINIPEGVTSIGEHAFYGYGVSMQLKTVNLPSTLTSIGSEAFQSCGAIEEITIPGAVTDFGSYAFWGCSGLETVTIENGVTAIGSDAFRDCYSLSSLTLPASLTQIGNTAFDNCTSLESVVLPGNLTVLGAQAFNNCTSLKSINIPKSLGAEGSTSNPPFTNCPSLSEITIENGITSIPDYLFKGCTGLVGIEIPSTVISIRRSAFEGCASLESIDIPDSVESIESYAFINCNSLESIKFPEALTVLNRNTVSGTSLKTVELGSNITAIYNSAIYECTALENIICNSYDIETIERYAVSNSPNAVFYGEHSASTLKSYAKDTLGRPFYGTDRHSKAEWSWSDDLSTASVKISCDDCDDAGTTVNAEVSSEITTPKTCTTDGVRTYTAQAVYEGNTYEDQKTKAIPATGHVYGVPEWSWDGYTAASAAFTCSACEDVQNRTAVITSEVTKKATCTEDGAKVYTATVTFEGKTYTNKKTEALKATGHSYGEPEWSWNGYASASAKFTCSACKDVQNKNASISSEVTKKATCTEDGAKVYTATVTFEGTTYTSTKTETLKATGHSYGEPEWSWNGYSSASAKFTCSACKDVQNKNAAISSEVTKKATCTEDGAKVYTATVTFEGKTYTNTKTETLKATGHSYSNSEWTWNGYTSASAKFTCANCKDVQTKTAMITSTVTKQATCTEDGAKVYTATVTFEGKTYTDTKTETLKATSHSYSKPVWTWSGYTSASAKFTCANCKDVQTKTAKITSTVTKQATCTASGTRTYTAKVSFNGKDYTDTKTETIPALNHSYSKPVWTWSGYTSASAKFTCANCKDVQTKAATITSTFTKQATCTASGTRTYTAKVSFNGKDYTDTKTETISALTHSYSKPVWTWSGYTSASAKFTCANCGDSKPMNAVISSTVTKAATCKATGIRTYTAKVTFDGKVYTDTKTETIPKLSHSYKTTVKKATTSANGSIEEKCSKCGSVKSKKTIYRISKFSLSDDKFVYEGKAIKPKVTVKDSNGSKIANTNYKLTYKNSNKVGKATVKVELQGNYSGSKTLDYKILPKGTTISKLTPGKAKIKVEWKTQTNLCCM